MTLTLEELFQHHGTDKGVHGYHTLYEELLPIPTVVTSVLEVGIGTLDPNAPSTIIGSGFPETYRPGASLRAWRDYFPNAVVYGLDPAPDTMITGEDRIVTQMCNSTEREQVNLHVDREFDLIVDDGDHLPQSQVATLTNLWPYLSLGGWYVIEDVYIFNLWAIRDTIGANWHDTIIRPSRSWWFYVIAIPKGVV